MNDFSDGAAAGFISGIVLTVLSLGLFMFFSDNEPRKGYFYVTSTTNGYVLSIDSPNANATVVTTPGKLEDTQKLCNTLNKDLSGRVRE